MNLTPVIAWASQHWQTLLAAKVIALGVLLLARSWRRADHQADERQKLSDQERAELDETTDRRGRRIEDALTFVVAGAAAYLSSTGLRLFGRHMMGLQPPWDWLPFVSLDVAALVCGMRARRRARNQEGPGLSGLLVWVLIGISALFSASEADTVPGAAARAVWPIIAGVLFELGSLEQRRAARRQDKRKAGEWLDRKLAAVRMLHPIEWMRVQLALAADETISQAEATRRVRIDRAGYRLYRLRRLSDLRKHGKSGKERAATRWPFFSRRPSERRVLRADRRAQEAQSAVPLEDLGEVLLSVLRRVRTEEMATLSYRSANGARSVLKSLASLRTETIGDGFQDTEPHPDTTGAGVHGDTGARTDASQGVPQGDTGTHTGAVESADDSRTAQVNAGTQDDESSEEELSDEKLIETLLRSMRSDGHTFTTGGIGKTAKALGVGTGRAQRLMDEARAVHAQRQEMKAHPDPQDEEAGVGTPVVIDLDQAWPVGELLTQRPIASAELDLVGPASAPAGKPSA